MPLLHDLISNRLILKYFNNRSLIHGNLYRVSKFFFYFYNWNVHRNVETRIFTTCRRFFTAFRYTLAIIGNHWPRTGGDVFTKQWTGKKLDRYARYVCVQYSTGEQRGENRDSYRTGSSQIRCRCMQLWLRTRQRVWRALAVKKLRQHFSSSLKWLPR